MNPRRDRDETLLVVLIALLAIPALGFFWVWLKRAGWEFDRAAWATFREADDDPLVLWCLVDLVLLLVTLCIWLWRDAGARGVGPVGRVAWMVALLLLGTLGLWIWLAARPPLVRRPVE